MTYKDQDLAMWHQWKQNPTDANTDALLKQMSPLIGKEVRRWSNIAPPFLLENQAKAQALKAFRTFDPSRNVALGTHVNTHLYKLSRTAYERQSTLSVPEAKRLSFNNLNQAQRRLEEELGRPPSLDELADHVRLPPKRVQGLLNEVGKRELLESGEGPSFVQQNDDPEVSHLVWQDLTPVQRKIFEMRTGYNDTPVARAPAIMKATGLTQGQLSHQLGKIKGVIEKAQALR